MIWRIAWRNLWRHRTRTLTMVSVVALSYALFLVSMGVGDDSHGQMLDAAIEGAGGEILVHGAGYWETRAGDIVIEDAGEVRRRVEGVEGVRAVIPRILIGGLVSTSAGNRAVRMAGIDPAIEPLLRDPAGDLVRGAWLDETARDDPIVLGAEVVRELELELGGRVVLTATGPDGEITRALFHLVGVVESGAPDVDERIGYTTLAAAREAVGMGESLTQIGVLTADDAARTVADGIRSALAAAGRGDGELEVLTWREAVPEMVGFIEIDDAFLYIYVVVIFLVVAFAIANTFLMAVMERVREFGLLNSLGLRGARIGRMLLSETALLTAIAMTAGFALAVAGHVAISHWGIPVAAYGLEEMELSGVDISDLVMRSTITPVKWVVGSALVALLTVGSALYPAWKASRLAPAEAMRFFE